MQTPIVLFLFRNIVSENRLNRSVGRNGKWMQLPSIADRLVLRKKSELANKGSKYGVPANSHK